MLRKADIFTCYEQGLDCAFEGRIPKQVFTRVKTTVGRDQQQPRWDATSRTAVGTLRVRQEVSFVPNAAAFKKERRGGVAPRQCWRRPAVRGIYAAV
ncbi:MAG: hypothetical protein WB555_15065 [Candidatus Korobacteraceae bacterium]